MSTASAGAANRAQPSGQLEQGRLGSPVRASCSACWRASARFAARPTDRIGSTSSGSISTDSLSTLAAIGASATSSPAVPSLKPRSCASADRTGCPPARATTTLTNPSLTMANTAPAASAGISPSRGTV